MTPRLHAAGPWADGTGAMLLFDTDLPGLEDVMTYDPYYRTPVWLPS